MGEVVKINRLSEKGGKIYISVCKDGNRYRSEESEVLSAIFGPNKDWDRVYDKLIHEVVAGRVQLIGRQYRIGYLREVLDSLDADAVEYLKKEDEETRNRISSLEIGARIATAEEAIRPAVKPFVIEMRDGETLAGCYIFRIGEDEQLTPYSTVDVAGKPKFFLSKDQAKQYIDTLKRKCPAWAGYNFQIRQRSNAEDFEGVAKIAKWCRSHDVEFAHVKTLKDSNGIRVKFYKFPQKSWYRLEAHQDTRTSTSYTLISSGKIDTKVTNQLRLIERLKQIFRVEDEK